MHRQLDQYCIAYWLNQPINNLADPAPWIELQNKLLNAGISRSVAEQKSHWIEIVDPGLDMMTNYKLPSRNELMYSNSENQTDQLKCLSERLAALKTLKILENEKESTITNSSIQADIGPSPVSIHLTLIQPKQDGTNKLFSRVLDSGLTPKTSIGTLQTQSTSFERDSKKRCFEEISTPKNDGSGISHYIKLRNKRPMKFEKREENSKSTDVAGFALPQQIFADKSFLLLEPVHTFVGLAVANTIEYIIKLYGGRIKENLEIISSSTIIIAAKTDQLVNKYAFEYGQYRIYSSDVIFDHIDKNMNLTTDSMENFLFTPVGGKNNIMDNQSTRDIQTKRVKDKDIDCAGNSRGFNLHSSKELPQSQPVNEKYISDLINPGGLNVTQNLLFRSTQSAAKIRNRPWKAECFRAASGANSVRGLAESVSKRLDIKLEKVNSWMKRTKNIDAEYQQLEEEYGLNQNMLVELKSLLSKSIRAKS